jgi:hypothetical protein
MLALVIRTFRHDERFGILSEDHAPVVIHGGSGWKSIQELQTSRMDLISKSGDLDCVLLPDGVLIWERNASRMGFRLVRAVTMEDRP